ncbi:MAG TPA: hypothetical protein VFQ45_18795 [Longimicrobium sp.]|nr:hypothetical protein [Longimicrobium sp.]
MRSYPGVLGLLVWASVQANTVDAQAPRVSIAEVQRACLLSPALQRPTLARVCALRVPVEKMSRREWDEWTAVFSDTAASVAGELRRFGAPSHLLQLDDLVTAAEDSLNAELLTDVLGIDSIMIRALLDSLPADTKKRYVQRGLQEVGRSDRPAFHPEFTNGLHKAAHNHGGRPAPEQLFDLAVAGLKLRDRLSLALKIPEITDALFKVFDGTVASSLARLDPSDSRLHTPVLQQHASLREHAAPLQRTDRQSALLWGTTDFVMDRAEQQLQTYMVQSFSGALCNEFRKRVLRNSCALLQPTSITLARPHLGLLHQAVDQDLQMLPYTALEWVYLTQNSRPEIAPYREEIETGMMVLRFVVETARGNDPILSLARMSEGLDSLAATKPSSLATHTLLGLAALFATHVDAAGIREISVGADTADLRDRLIAVAATLQETGAGERFIPWRIAGLATEMLRQVESIRQIRRSVTKHAAQDSAGTRHRRELLEALFTAGDTLLYHVAEMASVPGGLRIQRTTLALRNVVVPLFEDDYSRALLAINEMVAPHLENAGSARTRNWSRGITFFATVGTATSANEVSSALAGLVDPGGYLSKRSGRRIRVVVNAFGGALFAPEISGWFGERADTKVSAFAGPYLPIGIGITSGWDWRFPELTVGKTVVGGRRIGRPGIFFQVLDLGALASWRLDSDPEVDREPEATLTQVFSPGYFLTFDVTGAPLTLGVGRTIAPDLRRIRRDGEADERQVDAIRHAFFIAFDVPLFP